jgi:putative resolvase
VKLADWARAEGVHPKTAYRWFRHGKMPVPAEKTPSGSILVHDPRYAQPTSGGRTVVYARVSSHDQRPSLGGQVSRTVEAATQQGLAVDEVVTEVGSGLNGRRRRLSRLLADPTVTTIVVEHRDRLARFGVEHLEAALSAAGRRIVVVDDGETDDDLVRDMVEVLTSMCARLYGRRGARNRAEKALRCVARNVGPASAEVG